MDIERIIDDIQQLEEMLEAPDSRPFNAHDISAANRRHDEALASSPWFRLFVQLSLYRLLKDVDRTLAVLIVILGGLMQVPTYFLNVGNDLAALLLAKGQGYISVLDAPQRFAFARLFLDLHHQLDLANMLFAGLWLIPFGLLVYKSGFLPRLLGAW